ncbi:BolA family protein [Alloalcanivorax gelatiniphagus]|uniref:BolA/IbaG family iron-sulfur metabolism protein n=1 Tax=Alloalcanivorax gelatiniphagus TaxID=1194167 RepID=A0ABY2XNA9_9GAMM|nr:BolA/IbaG family iron-sulfur metabolism protein [Alloalcanivorax gelatiniphagus]TMW13912.1 BolA/IbaG family iron-sulfur metabolism protein [Alloalcanivorax gelatiniphagus]|tara:strand:- start:10091 stop:10423 length:333 start_codon:yes stop_codon:yes gene_type:complete
MTVAQAIESKVRDALPVAHLQLDNESHKHGVPPNSETHFKLVLVSEAFQGQMPVRRHQTVYGVLAEEVAGPVHALALHLFTPAEWQAQGGEVSASPDCLGGSKNDPEFGQ